MKTTSLILLLAAGPVLAGDPEPKVIDLGDGASVKIEKGKVEVQASSSSHGNGSVSRSVSSSTTTDANGNTVTTITTEHNGVKEVKTITTDANGKVSVADGDGKPSPQNQANGPRAGGNNQEDPDRNQKPDESKSQGGWLGVHTVPVPEATRAQVDIPEGEGIVIEFIAEGGPAAKAGLAENDILLRLNNNAIKDVPSFQESLRKSRPGEKIQLDYLRKGKISRATIQLADRPKDAETGGGDTSDSSSSASNQSKDQPGGQSKSSSKAFSGSSRRTVIIDENGNTRILEDNNAGDALEMMLNDPDIPAKMKEAIQEAKKKMDDLKFGGGK